MITVPTGLVSHSRKVCSLYKRALRNLECWYIDRLDYRYQAVLLRDRFDKNANIPDIRIAKQKLLEGEEELFRTQHYQPMRFPNSPGGVAFEREVQVPDWVLDFWDPMEKSMYPKYFATREKRKKEYIEWYFRQYPDVPRKLDHH